MHANHAAVPTTTSAPSDREPMQLPPGRPPSTATLAAPDHDPRDGCAEDVTEEAGYGYGV